MELDPTRKQTFALMLLLDGGSVPSNQKLAADQVYFNMKVFGLSTVNSTNFLSETIEVVL